MRLTQSSSAAPFSYFRLKLVVFAMPIIKAYEDGISKLIDAQATTGMVEGFRSKIKTTVKQA